MVNASIGDLDLPIGQYMIVDFDPMLPYIYIPNRHWNLLSDFL